MSDKNKEKTAKEWPLSISPKLLEAWQKLKRKGDPELMAERLGYSRPVIDRALIYGYISMPELIEQINKFFMDRLNRENETADRLLETKKDVERKTIYDKFYGGNE